MSDRWFKRIFSRGSIPEPKPRQEPKKIRIDFAEELRQFLSLPGDLPELTLDQNVVPVVNLNFVTPPEWTYVWRRPITSRRRHGRAFHYDDFEDYTALITEKWEQFGGTVALSTARPKTGLQSMLLTTGGAIGNQAIAQLHQGAVPLGRIGIEFDFEGYNAGEIASYRHFPYFGFRLTTLNFDDYAYVRYLGEANLLWQYYNPAGVWANIPNGAYNAVEAGAIGNLPNYHNVKMVVDFNTGFYVGLWIDSAFFDLKNLRFDRSVRAVPADTLKLTVAIGVTTATAAAHTMNVDNVILTDEEP